MTLEISKTENRQAVEKTNETEVGTLGEFPGSPVVRTPPGVWSLPGELRSPKPCDTAKKRNKDRSQFLQNELTKLTTA